MMTKNYYNILQINRDAPFEEIKNAYHSLVKIYNAKMLSNYSLYKNNDIDGKIEEIENAYHVLSDAEKKQLYDQSLEFTKTDSFLQNLPSYEIKYDTNNDFEVRIKSTQFFTGSFLQEIRQYKNITLSQMEEITKVSTRHLENIEADNYNQLPADIYVRGFLIQYARALKLDETLVTKSYLKLRNEKSLP